VHTTDDLLRERPSDIAPRVWSEIVLGQAQAALARNGTNPTQKRVMEMGQTHSPKRRLSWPWAKRVDDQTATAFVHPLEPFKFRGNEQALLDWRKGQGYGTTPGDYDDCVSRLSGKEGIDDPNALCAWLHHEVSGNWPGQEDRK